MNIEELTCKIECQELISQYFVKLDAGAHDELADLFVDDAVMPRPGGAAEGKAAIRVLFASLPPNFRPVHIGVNQIITQTGPDTADGITYSIVYNMLANEGHSPPLMFPPLPTAIGKIAFGFRKTADGWRISSFAPQAGFGLASGSSVYPADSAGAR